MYICHGYGEQGKEVSSAPVPSASPDLVHSGEGTCKAQSRGKPDLVISLVTTLLVIWCITHGLDKQTFPEFSYHFSLTITCGHLTQFCTVAGVQWGQVVGMPCSPLGFYSLGFFFQSLIQSYWLSTLSCIFSWKTTRVITMLCTPFRSLCSWAQFERWITERLSIFYAYNSKWH